MSLIFPASRLRIGPPRSASPLGTASGPLRSASPSGTASGPPRSVSLPGTDSGPPQSCGALPALVPAGPSARSIILHLHGPAGSWALKFQLKCHRGALPTHLSHAGATAVTPLPGLLHCTCHHSEKKIVYMCVCVLNSFSHVRLFATLWTVAHQAPLSMGFSRQEQWSGLPFPSPGDLPDPYIYIYVYIFTHKYTFQSICNIKVFSLSLSTHLCIYLSICGCSFACEAPVTRT